MNYITKIGLPTLIIVGLYSCHTPNKVAKADTTKTVDTAKKSIDVQPVAQPTDVDRDTSTQPLMTKVIFPDFSIKVNNTTFSDYKDNNSKFTYFGDSINIRNYKMWTLSTKTDTVRLNTDDGMGLDIGKIEILPNSKSDRFEISYSFKLDIVAENRKNGTLWGSMMPYKPIKDSLNYFFSTPTHNNMYAEMGSKIEEIKKKFNLKDTSFKKEADNGDYGTYTEDGVIFRNQLCEIPYSDLIYLKIDRFTGNRLMETKYLVIDFSIPE
jgi:hypothetical protein